MNERVWIAQADTPPVQNLAPLKVVTVVKPGSEQAITIDLGFDQKTKVDLSAVANEKMTMVHVGTKLIVLFDNHSTVTIEPFFDSTGKPLANLDVNLGAGHDVTGDQFASLFPITEDQSVLPAAGGGGSPASGADFHSPTVDPLAVGNPLPLLGPEELGNFQVNLPLGQQILQDFGPTVSGNYGAALVLEADLDTSRDGNDLAAGLTTGTDPLATGETAVLSGVTFTAGSQPIDVTFGNTAAVTVTEGGNTIQVFWVASPDGTHLDGYLVDPATHQGAKPAIELQLIDPTTNSNHVGANGTINPVVTVTLTDAFPHNASGHDTIVINGVPVVATDSFPGNDGTRQSATTTLEIDIQDDTPISTGDQTASPTLDDDSFAHGNLGGTGDVADADHVHGGAGALFTMGADGLKSITLDHATDFKAIFVDGNGVAHQEDVTHDAGVTNVDGSTTWTFSAHDIGTVATLTIGADGSYDFTTHAPLVHPTPGTTEENLPLEFSYTAIDGDGDTTSGSLTVNVNDDGPTLTGPQNVLYHADEGDIVTLRSLGTSPDDGKADGSYTGGTTGDTLVGPATVAGSVLGAVNFGADGEGSFSFTSNTLSTLQNLGLTSNGGTLSYELDGNTLIAYVNTAIGGYQPVLDRLVFALTLDPTSGEFVFRLNDQLDHVAPAAGTADTNTALQGANGPVDGLDFGSLIVATDGDGDSVTLDGKLTIEITDDIPKIISFDTTGRTVTIDETAGHQGNETTSGSVVHQFDGVAHAGSDPDMAAQYATNSRAIVSGTYLSGADDSAHAVLSLQISANGVDSGLTTTDGHQIYLFNESGVIVGRIDGDGGGVVAGGSNADVAAFAVSIDQSGHISVAQYLSIHNDDASDPNDTMTLGQTISAQLAVTDHDGDTAINSIAIGDTIQFNDDGPTLTSTASVTAFVDEDGLSWGNQDSNPALPGEVDGTDSATATSAVFGNLATLINFGADGEGSFGFKTVDTPQATGLTSEHQAISIEVVNGALIGFTGSDPSQNQVFTLTLGTDGSYTFNLLKEMDHPSLDGHTGDNSENSLSIDLSGYITATDGDGDHVDLGAGSFTVSVLDDIPVITARPTGSVSHTGDDSTWDLKGGNADLRFFSGTDHGLVLTSPDGTVNTSNNEAWVGSGGAINNGEHLQLAFVTSDGVTHEEQSSATFTVNRQGAAGTYDVHIDASTYVDANTDAPVNLTFVVTGSTYTLSGNAATGYTLSGLADGAIIKVEGASGATFDKLMVENTGSHNFDIADIGAQPADTFTPETFTISEDETAGINTAGDPNPANDVAAPASGTDAYNAIYHANAIGYAESAESVLVSDGANNFTALFTGNAGADQPGTYSFAVTDASGNALAGVDSGLTTLDHTHILLTTAADGSLVGSANGAEVFKVYVDHDGHVWIAQYQPIYNPVAGSDAAAYDDIATVTADLHIKGTLTDSDGDSVSAVSGVSLQVQFQDDGPTLTVTAPNSLTNSLFFDGFTPNGDVWGTGSGIDATGVSGGWTISTSGTGSDGSGTVQLERVGDGYQGMHSSTHGFMVDLDASARDVKLTQTVGSLTTGESYVLTFEAGAPFPNSAHLEVWFGGQKVFDLNPTNAMQTYSLELFGGSGDGSNTLEFRETGTPDNQGTYIANVRMGDVIVIDETAGHDSDSNETDNPAVAALFHNITITDAGHDSHFGAPQYATGSNAALNYAGDFGTDGPLGGSAAAATSYSLAIGNANSGLFTTDGGHAISLSLDGNIVVGRYDSNGDTTLDSVAFAFTIDPQTGVVSVVQYVALQHPDHTSTDEGIYLNAGTLSAQVTITDGDGDHVTQGADISTAIRFEDDGPSASYSGRLTLQESANNDGSFHEQTAHGQFAFDGGADGATVTSVGYGLAAGQVNDPETQAFTTVPLTSDGQTISFSHLGGDPLILVGTRTDGTEVFQLKVTDAATGTYDFTQLAAIDHPDHNEIGAADPLRLKFAFTVTDSDGDTATNSNQIDILDGGPTVVAAPQSMIVNGDYSEGAHWSAPDWWGSASTDVTGWSITASPVDPGTLELDRAPDGLYGMHSSTGGYMVDLGSSPGNIQLTQSFGTGLVAGQTYAIQFEAGAPFPETAKLEVIWNGHVIGTIDPSGPGLLTSYNYIVTATGTSGDSLTFREIGTGDAPLGHDQQGHDLQTEGYQGTYLANVKLIPTSVVDEDGLPKGNQDLPTPSEGDAPGLATSVTGVLGINWGADNYDSATADTVSGDHFVQDGGTMSGRSVVFTDAGVDVSGASGLTSKGDAVTLTLTDSDTVLVGTAMHDGVSRAVFEVSLSDDGTGAFKFDLKDALDQAPNGSENDLDLTFHYTATDSDGDSAQGTFTVGVDDDMPIVTAAPDTVSLNESGLLGSPSVQAATGFLHINWGADNGDSKHLSFAKDADGHVIGPALSSGGVPLDYIVRAATDSPGNEQILAFRHGDDPSVDGNIVFSITLYTSGTGYYTAALYHPIDDTGQGADTQVLNFTVLATDSDGDTIALNPLQVSIVDSIPHPVIATTDVTLTIDETAGDQPGTDDILGSANTPIPVAFAALGTPIEIAHSSGAVVSVSPSSSYGADGQGATPVAPVFALSVTPNGVDSGLTATDGHKIYLYQLGDIVVGRESISGNPESSGTIAIAIAIDSTTGAATVAEYTAIQHGDANNPNDSVSMINGALQATVTFTDGDGNHVTSAPVSIGGQINFLDDGPVAHDLPSQNVAEGALPVMGTLDFVQGADGATVTQVNGTNLAFDNTTGWSQVFHTMHGDFQVKADGSYQFTAQANDVYNDSGTTTFTYTVTDGDGDTSTAQAAFVVQDTLNPTTVSLSGSTTTEGANANYVFTATLSNQSHGDTVVHTDQGDITITDGNATGTLTIASGNGEDVYNDTSQKTATITNASGGNFEELDIGNATATSLVNDTLNPTTVSLSGSTMTEGANANYVFTATLSNQSHGDTVVHTDQGDITITDGNTTGTLTIASGNGEDVYNDASQKTATITSASGGNFEELDIGNATAISSVNDTTNTVTATLTAGDAVFGVNGVTVTYTVTLTNNNGLSPIAPTDNQLEFALQSGQTVHIAQGVTSGTVDVLYNYGTFGPTITNSIAEANGAGEYENLLTAGSPVTHANTVPIGGGSVSLTLSEAALDTVLDPNDLHAGAVTGTTPSSTGETAQATTGITFTATGENLTLAFDPSVSPTITGLAGGYTLSWSLSGGELVGHLIQTAGNVDLGAFVYLALDTTSAAAGTSVTLAVTATLVDNLFHSAGTGPVTIDGLQVVATDTSGDHIAGSVNLTIGDDTPLFGTSDHGIVSDQVDATILGDLHLAYGADGANATHALSLVGNTAPNGLTLDGTHAILYSVSADGAALTGYVDNNHNSTFDAGDTTAFTLALNASAGDYMFTLDTPFTEGINIGGSGTGYGSGPNLQNPLTLTINNVVTQIATVSALSGHQVSGSSGGWGVDNANFDNSEHMRFDFTDGAVNSPNHVATFHAAPPEFADFNFSKDGLVIYNVHYVDGSSTGNVTVTENGSLHLGSAGQLISYIDFTSNGSLGKLDLTHIGSVVDASQDLSFNVTATDGDGDTAIGNIGIHLEGSSALAGTAGVDVFGIGSHSGVETFTNFSSSDKLDLTGLLDSIYSGAQNQSDINVVVDSSNLKVQVADTSHVFHDVAVLSGYNTAGSDAVNVILNDATHQAHVYTA